MLYPEAASFKSMRPSGSGDPEQTEQDTPSLVLP